MVFWYDQNCVRTCARRWPPVKPIHCRIVQKFASGLTPLRAGPDTLATSPEPLDSMKQTTSDVDEGEGDGIRAADALTTRLAGMIASGELPPGSWLPTERELMRRFGVSRAVVRESIAGLATQHMLISRRGFRPVSASPTTPRPSIP